MRSLAVIFAPLLALGIGVLAADARAEPPTAASITKARTATAEGARSLSGGRLEGAERSFRTALELVPESSEARKNLALVLSRLCTQRLRDEDGVGALEAIDEALVLHPGRTAYRVDRASALLLTAREGEALRLADDLVQGHPRYIAAWLVRADVTERMGDLPAAVASLEKALPLAARSQAAPLARRLAELRRRNKAEAGFLTHSTGNFIARYGPDADAGTVQLALTILEDAYSRVTANLALSPKTPARVILYEGGEFQEATGAHGWVGALYEGGTLQVPIRNLERHRDTAERILSHEFTHHVLRQNAPGLPVWWHEGIAQHEEVKTPSKERQYQHVVGQMKRLRTEGALLSLDTMQRTRVASVSDVSFVTLYYAQARSFVEWLVGQYGSGALPSFLVALGNSRDTSAACAKAFGKSEAELWRLWSESL